MGTPSHGHVVGQLTLSVRPRRESVRPLSAEPLDEVRRVGRNVEVACDDERALRLPALRAASSMQLLLARRGAARRRRRAQVHADDREDARGPAHARFDRGQTAERERRARLELVGATKRRCRTGPRPETCGGTGKSVSKSASTRLGVRRQLLHDEHVGPRFAHDFEQPARRELAETRR